MTNSTILSLEETKALIHAERTLLIAGDEALLSQLPSGQWIAGTSANFMTNDGGIETTTQLFVTDITDIASDVSIETYTEQRLPEIGNDYPANGFTILIIPGMSAIHSSFARNVQNYEGVFNAPLTGWISGIPVSEIGKRSPKVFSGSGQTADNCALAMHVSLRPGKAAKIDIINLFTQGSGAAISFEKEGFESTGECVIDGKKANLATYITDNKINTQLPLVADYNGAMVNVSIQSVDKAMGKVAFYAPVFKDVTYRFAKPIDDYTSAFEDILQKSAPGHIAFSCNCILNFLYAKLEGKKTGDITGPITFGEIAYMLLNQTLVYLTIEDV